MSHLAGKSIFRTNYSIFTKIRYQAQRYAGRKEVTRRGKWEAKNLLGEDFEGFGHLGVHGLADIVEGIVGHTCH